MRAGTKLPYVAYAYTTAYPKDAYMGMFISDLQFYARSYTKAEGGKIRPCHGADRCADRGPEGRTGQSCAAVYPKAIVPLPGAPVYIEEPGSWDGSNPAVS